MITRWKAFWLSFTTFLVAAVLADQTQTTTIDILTPSPRLIHQATRLPIQYLKDPLKGWTGNPYKRAIQGRLGIWDMVAVLVACGLVKRLRTKWTQRARGKKSKAEQDRSSPEKQRTSTEQSGRLHDVGIDSS
jgi:hypothetical protein